MLTQLKQLGLSDNEAKVYLAMLELGSATMLEISTKAGINRPTAYVQIESLKKIGLVSTQVRGKKTYFIAESPKQLESILEREEKEIELKKDELAKILPELATLFSLGDRKPVVRFFEGVEGIHKVHEEFIKSGATEILDITSLDDAQRVFPNQLRSYAPKRAARGIRSKVIYTSSRGAVLPAQDGESLRETKYIDAKKFSFGSDIAIFGDNVVISSFKGKLSATVITDLEIANSFRNLFNFLWSLL